MAERFASVSEDELCEKCIIKQLVTSCLCYLPQPSASADNTDLGFDNSCYHAQPHPIIVYYLLIYYRTVGAFKTFTYSPHHWTTRCKIMTKILKISNGSNLKECPRWKSRLFKYLERKMWTYERSFRRGEFGKSSGGSFVNTTYVEEQEPSDVPFKMTRVTNR